MIRSFTAHFPAAVALLHARETKLSHIAHPRRRPHDFGDARGARPNPLNFHGLELKRVGSVVVIPMGTISDLSCSANAEHPITAKKNCKCQFCAETSVITGSSAGVYHRAGCRPDRWLTMTAERPKKGSAQKGSESFASAPMSAEQNVKFRETLKGEKAERLTNVQFSISIGETVPRSVHFYRLPARIVEYAPQYRDFDYILVGDDILIADPSTHRIVAVISA